MGNCYNYYSTSQFIYTAEELGGAKSINSIAFNHNAYSMSSTVNIYLAHTTASTVDVNNPATEGTLVSTLSESTIGGSAAGWQTFNFSTPFEYNGTDNLLVVVCRTKYNSGWSNYIGWQYTATSDNKFMTRNSDSSGYDDITNTSYSYTAYANRPNVIIGYVPTTPYISLDPTSETVLVGFTKTLTATYGNVSGTPTIIYSSDDESVATVTGSGTSATVTAVAPGTATITATMTYNATDYTATCAVTVEEPSYCTPSFSNTSDYIESFTTTGGEQNIDNQNSGQGTGGYSNFYDTHFVSAEPETEIGFSVVRGYNDNYNYAIWVDWNKDYEFDNTTEKVAYTTSSTGDWTGTFTIPTTAAAGDYHMRVLQVYSSAATPCVSASYGEGEDYKLTVLAGNPYEKPVNLQVSSLTGTSAIITWEAPNTDVVGYKYQYQPQGGDWTALTSTTALSAQLPVLTSNTTYTFQVQAIYAGGNESGFASKTFTTLIAIPYEYGFEDATEFGKWETVDCEYDDSNYLSGVVTYAAYAHSGNNFFSFSSYNGATDPQYLISPALSGIANGLHVSFYYRSANNNDPETFMVGYSTTDTDPDSFTWSTEVTSPDDNYAPYAVNFMVSEIKYVAIKYTSGDSFYLFVDDITFEEAPDCLEPTNVNAINITTTTADITWTNGGSETSWDIFATDDSTIVPDGTTTPTVEGVTTKPHQLTLQPGTTYYVYVRAACSSTETSAWSSPAVFHTDCEGMDLPYGPYGFEDGALTVCWNILSTNTAYNTVSMNTTASYIHTGDYSLLMHSGSADGDFVVALPVIDDLYSLSDYRFIFWAMATNTDLKVTIGIMENPNDMTTFVAQSEEFNPASEFTEYKVPFNGYTGDGQYVAIKVSRASGSNYGNVYFDDIAIELTPSCIEPSGLTVSNETAHGATFSWTNGGSETVWHLYFGKDATAPADDIQLDKVTVADSNPFTMTTGLDPETDYYVWVRANCGGGDGYSMWVGPETFTTAPSCFVPTGLAVSEINNHTATFSWTGTSDSYIVKIGEVVTTPFKSYDFEDNAISADFTNSATYPWTATAGGYNSSSYCATPGNKGVNSSTSDLTLALTLTENATISFYAKVSSESDCDYGRFLIDGTQKVNISGTTSTWTKYEYDLTAGTHTLIWRYFKDYSMASGDDLFYVDDIIITKKSVASWMTYNTASSPFTVNDPVNIHPETNYAVKVQGNCGSEGLSQESAPVFFTTDIACPAPTGLTASNPTSVSFDLQWTNGGSEDWIVAYKKTTETDFSEINLNESDVTVEGNLRTYTLGNLDAETEYIVKVQDNCEASYAGDGQSEWTAEVNYSTIAACSAMNPVVSDITHHNATVNWEGESADGFTVNYRVAAGEDALFEEGFENGLGSWTFTSMNVVNGIGGTGNYPAGIQSAAAHSDSYGFRFSSYSTKSSGETYDQYLVSPELTVTGTLKFYAKKYDTYDDYLYVGYSTTTSDLDAFTWDVEAIALTSSWNEFTHALPTDVKYFAFHYFGDCKYYVFVDDIAITVPTSAGAWQTQAATGTTADLTSLTSGTLYDVKVVPNCDETLESATVQFTTLVGNMKYFLTAGEWGTAANWMDEEIPAITDNATIRANVTITGEAAAKKITFQGSPTPTLTINDGGQLQTDNTVTATVKKTINGYNTGNDKYYLVATPLSSSGSPTNYGMITDDLGSSATTATATYDLYKWDYTAAHEWKNYRQSTFNLSNGTGYLYAHKATVNPETEPLALTFTGTVKANNTDETKNLTYSAGTYDFNGWNLVGNPFVCNAYVTDVNDNGSEEPVAFYRMNGDGDNFKAATGAIKPMEGIFVQATKTGQSFKFTRTAPVTSNGNGNLNIQLAKKVTSRDERAATDNAIIRFDGGNNLSKISFREGSTKVYIPQDGKDYAVVSAEAKGEMPLNFKAETIGNYTISISTEDINFSYLRLIDNFTGENVDLLVDPEYTFIGSPRDNENRFRIVFSTNANGNVGANDIFAYQSDDEIIINGKGELQIFDVMGRFVTSMKVNGNEHINAESFRNAVYIFRLVGDDVKTQKIVVR